MSSTANSEPESYEARESRREIGTQTGFSPSSRYSRPPLFTGSTWDIFLRPAPFMPSHSSLARERTVFNTRPIGQYRGAMVTAGWTPFLLSTPFGHVGPGYIYRILTSESSVHPVGVKGLASWRRTVVQSAQRKDPSFFWIERSERQRKREDRGVAEERLAASMCSGVG